jgi:hypothetical protein
LEVEVWVIHDGPQSLDGKDDHEDLEQMQAEEAVVPALADQFQLARALVVAMFD